MLLAIDPGENTGWALFFESNLLACGLGSVPDDAVPTEPFNAVIEHPMIYPGGRNRGDPNDIVKLAVKAGEIAGCLKCSGASVRYVKPYEWKGQTPKHISAARTRGKLSDAERGILAAVDCAPGKMHNILDAVGIGLFALGR